MTPREMALAHLRRWTTPAETLPAGAALLEPVVPLTTVWAIRHPRTGALFGWHADPARLASLYWDTLAADDRYALVAHAVRALETESHRKAWKSAWEHWTANAGAKNRALELAIIAWLRRDRRALDAALSALCDRLFPDAPAPRTLGGSRPELPDARLALDLATTALVAGETDLARHIHVYAVVAADDRRQLPALHSALTAVSEHLDSPFQAPTAEGPK